LRCFAAAAALAAHVTVLEREADRFERNCQQLVQYYQSMISVASVWVRQRQVP